jgi:hypothetical protein
MAANRLNRAADAAAPTATARLGQRLLGGT